MATPAAAYALIEDNKVELKRVAYPFEETIARLQASPLPDQAKEMLAECYRNGRLSRPLIEHGSRDEDDP